MIKSFEISRFYFIYMYYDLSFLQYLQLFDYYFNTLLKYKILILTAFPSNFVTTIVIIED